MSNTPAPSTPSATAAATLIPGMLQAINAPKPQITIYNISTSEWLATPILDLMANNWTNWNQQLTWMLVYGGMYCYPTGEEPEPNPTIEPRATCNWKDNDNAIWQMMSSHISKVKNNLISQLKMSKAVYDFLTGQHQQQGIFPQILLLQEALSVHADPDTRVVHGFGRTRGFCRAGPAGTGPVSDLPTRANTVPVTGYPRVSATRSHVRREWFVRLAPPVTHFNGKSPSCSPAPAVSYLSLTPAPSCPGCLECAVSSLLSRDGPLETALALALARARAVPQGHSPRARRLESPPPLPASRRASRTRARCLQPPRLHPLMCITCVW